MRSRYWRRTRESVMKWDSGRVAFTLLMVKVDRTVFSYTSVGCPLSGHSQKKGVVTKLGEGVNLYIYCGIDIEVLSYEVPEGRC